jgi:hypothetical protein
MWNWLWSFALRYGRFLGVVGTIGKGIGWLLGYDILIEGWISDNRGLMVIVLVLSAIIYAMYHWLDSSEF